MPPRAKKNEQFGNPFETDEPPFETEPPQDEPEADNHTPETPSEKAQAVKKVFEVDGQGKITVTLKAGTGYDAPWVVIHGLDVQDVMTTMNDPDFPKLLNWTTGAAQKFGEGWTPAPKAQNNPPRQNFGQNASQGVPQGQPPAATQHPKGERKFCQHGEMTFKSAVSQKTGKPWYAFDCPQNVCQREFVKI